MWRYYKNDFKIYSFEFFNCGKSNGLMIVDSNNKQKEIPVYFISDEGLTCKILNNNEKVLVSLRNYFHSWLFYSHIFYNRQISEDKK